MRHDGPERVRCPSCEQILAEVVAGMYVVRYKGREFVAADMKSIRCERCTWIWKPDGAQRAS